VIYSRLWTLLRSGRQVNYAYKFPAGIGRLCALSLSLRSLYSGDYTGKVSSFLRVAISPENPVTAGIFMKTIIKLRMRFFPYCIMGFKDSRFTRIRRLRRYSRARGSSLPCRLPRLRSLTTEYIDISRWPGPMACEPYISQAIRRPLAMRLTRQLLILTINFALVTSTGG